MSLPPSSPRLPSPPPPAEIQLGPQSPLMGPNASRQSSQIEQTAINTNAKRRIHPGTKAADMAAGPPLVPLQELDSAFQLQEHLAALHDFHTSGRTIPITRDIAKLLATPPPGIDKTLWLFELCRFLIAQCNTLIIGFLFDNPPCSAATCPEMRAGEWQFLCAVHDAPKSCCAIDYCCHTLDWATNVVTNPKIFPSRFVVDAHDKNTALKNLVNVFRRLHRVFAHAWFQHRGVFWSVEGQSGLYLFFKSVCDAYDLLPAENYKLPPEAEGLDSNAGAGGDLNNDRNDRRQPQHQQQTLAPISIAKPPGTQRDNDDGDFSGPSRTNTRRHIKSSPSTGSAVTTVPEADEDDSDLSHRLRGMRLSAPRAITEEETSSPSSSNIPVIVEHRAVEASEQPIRPSSVIPPPGPGETAAEEEAQPASDPPVETPATATATVPEHEFAAEPEAPSLPTPETETETETETQEEPAAETEPESESDTTQILDPTSEDQEDPAEESAQKDTPSEPTDPEPVSAPSAEPTETSTKLSEDAGEDTTTATSASEETPETETETAEAEAAEETTETESVADSEAETVTGPVKDAETEIEEEEEDDDDNDDDKEDVKGTIEVAEEEKPAAEGEEEKANEKTAEPEEADEDKQEEEPVQEKEKETEKDEADATESSPADAKPKEEDNAEVKNENGGGGGSDKDDDEKKEEEESDKAEKKDTAEDKEKEKKAD
ncbi:hypothetical protein B0J18DRAFT_453921 [Chaetomium sp. MPI-SDFR-AT-0129]|nr:hypothetical protein B0J18DRAFT_453921 [Chaetomium sp. MPI-SDFR-AT-0129]